MNLIKEMLESPIFKYFFENIKYFSYPNEFNAVVKYPIDRMLKLVLQKKFNKSEEIAELYLDYDFLENNVSNLCSQLYGLIRSSDKGRFLVRSYIHWRETGEMPKFNWEGEYTFQYPETGTEQQWMDFVSAVHRLKYGYNKEYLIALQDLIIAPNNH